MHKAGELGNEARFPQSKLKYEEHDYAACSAQEFKQDFSVRGRSDLRETERR